MRTFTRPLAAAAATLALAGGVAPAIASAAAKTQTLTISAAKGGALMFSTKTLKAKPGKTVIKFTNNSPESHSFTLSLNGRKVAGTPIFDGGTKSITVTLKKGTYTYYCTVPGHRAAGMQGTLKVS